MSQGLIVQTRRRQHRNRQRLLRSFLVYRHRSSRIGCRRRPATLSVNADPTGLAAGFYRTQVDLKTSAGTAGIPVTLFIATGSSMTLQPSGTVFTSVFGPAPQGDTVPTGGENSFLIDVVGTTPVNWTATASVASGPNWITLTTPSGMANFTLPGSSNVLPGTVSFTINQSVASKLAVGAYYGTIQVSAPGIVNSPLNFEIVLNLSANAIQAPEPSPTGLLYISAAGSQPPPQTLQVTNNLATASNLTLSSPTVNGGNWLSAAISPSAPAGPVAVGATVPVLVSVNPSNLNAGTYTGSVTLNWVGYPMGSTVNVTLLVPLASQAVQQDRPDGEASNAIPGTCTPTQIVPPRWVW